MGMSDRIEAFILELLKQEQDDWLKIQRNELAEVFGCVPSQINYVISTRFNNERGYDVQSRRGGGGCVMIRRTAEHTPSLSEADGIRIIEDYYEKGYLTKGEATVAIRLMSRNSLRSCREPDRVRGDMLKELLGG